MTNWKIIDRKQLEDGQDNRLVYLTPAHAPSLVTTIAPNGVVNVGAFEQTMLCSNNPPMILLAISPKSDTLKNLIENKECVVGFPCHENLQETYDAGVRLPRDESELDVINGLTTADSETVKPPRLEQCWFSAEAKLVWHKESGDHVTCCVEVQRVIIDELAWSDNRAKRRKGLPASYYATAGEFFRPGEWTHVEMSDEVKKKEHAD